MNTKSKVLIGLMAVCLLGTVGSALALTRTGAGATGNPGAFDKAINLYWDEGEHTSVTIANVENLTAGSTQYRGLSVNPISSKSLEGKVRLSFVLAASEGEHHIKGLTVSVYKIAEKFDAENVETQIAGKEASPVLNEENLTGVAEFDLDTGFDTFHYTHAYYAIAINWTGAIDTEHPSYTLDASVTITQSFVAGA
jgi:hypothetical protein